jgi:hypothetical protein
MGSADGWKPNDRTGSSRVEVAEVRKKRKSKK